MGAFDGELYALGYRFPETTSKEESDKPKPVQPEVGKQYWTWFMGKKVKIEILSMHNQLGIFKLLEPVRKRYDIGYIEEDYFVIRTQAFYPV